MNMIPWCPDIKKTTFSGWHDNKIHKYILWLSGCKEWFAVYSKSCAKNNATQIGEKKCIIFLHYVKDILLEMYLLECIPYAW